MRFIPKITFFALLLIFLSSLTAKSQVAITAVPFLDINTDPRSMGLGGATVGMRSTTGGMHLNPATIGTRNTIELFTPININGGQPIFSSSWLGGFNSDIYLQNPGAIVGFEKLALGYQHKYLNLSEQWYSNPSGNSADQTFEPYEYVNTFSASYEISNDLYVGTGFSFGKSVLLSGFQSEKRAATFKTVDVGVYGEHTYNGEHFAYTPSFGWSLNDFGEPVKYGVGVGKNPLPMMMRGGIGLRADTKERIWNRTTFSIGGYASVSKIMARLKQEQTPSGVRYKPMGPWEALFKSWDSYTRFNGQRNVELSLLEQLQTQVGLEFIYLEMLSIRFGHYYEDPQNGDRSFNTLGIGLEYENFSFDYFVIDSESRSVFRNTQFFQLKLNIPLPFKNTLGL